MKKKPKFIAKIESEHESLNHDLENFKLALRAWIESEDLLIWKIEFIWQMREFMHRLFKHFDFEEESGVFDHIIHPDSKGTPCNKMIKTEHKQILKKINKILTSLRKNKEVKNNRLKMIKKEILDLISDISRHEEKEIALINSLYNREGTGVFRKVKEASIND